MSGAELLDLVDQANGLAEKQRRDAARAQRRR